MRWVSGGNPRSAVFAGFWWVICGNPRSWVIWENLTTIFNFQCSIMVMPEKLSFFRQMTCFLHFDIILSKHLFFCPLARTSFLHTPPPLGAPLSLKGESVYIFVRGEGRGECGPHFKHTPSEPTARPPLSRKGDLRIYFLCKREAQEW